MASNVISIIPYLEERGMLLDVSEAEFAKRVKQLEKMTKRREQISNETRKAIKAKRAWSIIDGGL